MSDSRTLDPRSLTSKDPKAVVREVFPAPPSLSGWLGFYYDSGFYDSAQGTREDAGWYCSGKVHRTREDALCELAGFHPFEGSAVLEIVSGVAPSPAEPPAQEEAKVCPHCLDTPCMRAGGGQPAQEGGYQPIDRGEIATPPQGGTGTIRKPTPEGELPEAVRRAVNILRVRSLIEMPGTYKNELIEVSTALESLWCSLPKREAVPVDMPNVRELVSLLLWKIKAGQGDIAVRHYEGLLKEAQVEIDRWLAGLEGRG